MRIVVVPTVSNDLGATISVKFVRINDLRAWKFTAPAGLVSSYSTYSDILNDVSYSNLASGYPIDLPPLPDGRYYMYIFDGAKSTITETTRPSRAFDLAISAGSIVSPYDELVSDGVR